LDLYGFAGNRLLKGFEYTAQYNLGGTVPFVETLDRTGKYHQLKISDDGRGNLRAIYEEVYNHYVNRMGISAPFTQRAAERIRPEGPGLPGADHPGFGTLLFTRPPNTRQLPAIPSVPAPPAGLIAKGSSAAIKLSWVASVNSDHYTVKKASGPGEPYTVLADHLTEASLTDTHVHSGLVYYYTVSASNAQGESGDAMSVSERAGLP
jgi:hypothetical protein